MSLLTIPLSINIVLLYISPHTPSSSCILILKIWLPELGRDGVLVNNSSKAWSKLPSKANRAVALPTPGSVSQKYSADWILIERLLSAGFTTIDLEKVLPHNPFSSFKRILKTWMPWLGTVILS